MFDRRREALSCLQLVVNLAVMYVVNDRYQQKEKAGSQDIAV